MHAVSDTGPLHYLVLIGHVGVVAALLDRVAVSETVQDELLNPGTPERVRVWMASPPSWLSVHQAEPADFNDTALKLDAGERDTIALAARLRPDLILMDDRAGVTAARALGFNVTGTLGLLYRSARSGALDLPQALASLAATNFRHTPALLRDLVVRLDAERNAR